MREAERQRLVGKIRCASSRDRAVSARWLLVRRLLRFSSGQAGVKQDVPRAPPLRYDTQRAGR
jgi:hypothetical protein